MAIIGSLAAVIIVRASQHIDNGAVKSCFHNRTQINSAIERYTLMEGSVPSLSDLDDEDYLPGGVPNCPVTGNAYTIDSGTNRVLGHTSVSNPGDH